VPYPGQGNLNQRAVLWRVVGQDGNAQPVVSNVAVGIPCRWDDRRRTVQGPDGTPIAVDATALVDREIAVGSAMWKGDVPDLPDTQIPDRDVFVVVTYTPEWDWRGVDCTHEVALVKAGNTLPTTGADPDDS
jgi:hypothetical protein